MRTKSILFIFLFSFFSMLAFSQGEPPKGFSGEWVTKYKSGKVSFKGKYVAGKADGKSFYYFESGQVRFEGSYVNGLKEGMWIAYFDNGQIRFKAKYVKGDQSGDRIYY